MKWKQTDYWKSRIMVITFLIQQLITNQTFLWPYRGIWTAAEIWIDVRFTKIRSKGDWSPLQTNFLCLILTQQEPGLKHTSYYKNWTYIVSVMLQINACWYPHFNILLYSDKRTKMIMVRKNREHCILRENITGNNCIGSV